MTTSSIPPIRFPRITIEFCTQCKWNLRAAYFAQELLQTFSTSIGEISLIPVTGGIFTITLYHHDPSESQAGADIGAGEVTKDESQHTEQSSRPFSTSIIWDRKRDGGFPETKELKNRVRNIIEPGRDMGHVDRALRKGKQGESVEEKDSNADANGDGQSKAGESSTRDDNRCGDAQVLVKQPTQAVKKSEGLSTVHAGHKDSKSPPDGCEECKEAMNNEEGQF